MHFRLGLSVRNCRKDTTYYITEAELTFFLLNFCNYSP